MDVRWMVEVQSFPGDSSAINGQNSMQGMDVLNRGSPALKGESWSTMLMLKSIATYCLKIVVLHISR